ncbi:hypothetical protein AGIG_G8914 [Arapaima gigas]
MQNTIPSAQEDESQQKALERRAEDASAGRPRSLAAVVDDLSKGRRSRRPAISGNVPSKHDEMARFSEV